MKPSHRKDVIIARIIFVAICIALISVIAAVIFVIVSKHSNTAPGDEPQQIESESQADTNGSPYDETIPSTEQHVVQDTYVVTTSSVNLREQADKNAKILSVLKEGTQLKLISEDNGWTQVDFNGQIGYVSSDYVKQVDQNEQGETDTTENSQTTDKTGSEAKSSQNGSHVVVIDPGHQAQGDSSTEPNGPGSSEMKAKVKSGTSGTTTGVNEYELTLNVGLKLRDELQARGYTVYMTRDKNDVNISNKERAEYASQVNGEIAVRLHANGVDSASVSGALALCPSTSNKYVSNLAAQSEKLSKYILNEYCSSTGMKNQGIQENDTMTGMNWSKVPVTILEMGYMTNESDDRNMEDASYQDKMVKGIADGIDKYFTE